MKKHSELFILLFSLFAKIHFGCNGGEALYQEDAGIHEDGGQDSHIDGDNDGEVHICGEETCPSGCCLEGVCRPLTDSTCGLGGESCNDCTSSGWACNPTEGKCCATCGTLLVKKGDMIFRGRHAVERDHPDYLNQSVIRFFSAGARVTGLLAPKWGENLGTWDDTSTVTGRRTIWFSAEIASTDGILNNPEGEALAVLRPTEKMLSKVHLDAMVERFMSTHSQEPFFASYPFVGIFLRWTKWARDNGIDWVTQTDLGTHWKDCYGFDVDEMETPMVMQGDPYNLVTDIDSAHFWNRTMSPGARIAWALIWGERVLSGDSVREFYLGHSDRIAGVDSISPGQLAWWLLENDMAYPATSEVSIELSFRRDNAHEWEGYAIGRAPFEADLLVDIHGGLPEVEVEVRCKEEEPVVWSDTVDLPSTLLLEDICTYSLPGWFNAVVTIKHEDVLVAENRITATAVPEQITVQTGDVLMFASPVPSPWSSDYLTYAYLIFMSEAGKKSGVSDSFWGEDLVTLDDTSAIVGRPAIWGHVEIADTPTEIYFDPDPLLDIIILRPTEVMAASVDMDAAASRTFSGLYNQPFVGLFFNWLDWMRTNETWFTDTLLSHWSALYGVDLSALMPVMEMQWSEGLGTQAHSDLESDLFWNRDHNCSSSSAWQIIWGWYIREDEAVREVFLEDQEAVGAVDGVSPGQLGSWLLELGFVDVVNP